VAKTAVSEFTDHFHTNVLGSLVLFQATADLLRKASTIGKFIVISSVSGSTGDLLPGPLGAYGTSKAAVNHLVRRIQVENNDLIVLPIW
jgi:norsolorinic acid ketoreductase